MLKMQFLSLTLLFGLLAVTKTTAQPVITSFTPSTGPVGTTLTITGTGFNPSPGGNIVYLGAVKAGVTGGNATSLTAVVPAGATYQPISVLNTGTALTGYASKPFITTFPNPSGSGLNGAYYLPKIDIPVAQFPTAVTLGDIDGDGKPDMVVSTRSPGSISVFRNISVTGSVTAASFAPKVDFATNTPYTSAVNITDMDGDGKPDIVVSNESANTISVFRNVSTPGSFTASSLAPRTDLPVPGFGSPVSIGDLDGDGKPDIAIARYFSDTVLVLHNDATPGNLTAAAFASTTGFRTGPHPGSLSVNDMDGDGRPDLVTACDNSISILRNTSGKSLINSASFATKVDFPVNHTLRVISTSDVDGDGRPEIMVTSQDQSSTSQVSVLRNVAVPGTINLSSFSSPVDFLTGSAPVAIQNGDVDGDGKPDMVILTLGNSSASVFRNTATQGTIATSSFATRVDFPGSGDMFSVAIGDIDGDAIPELVMANVVNGVSIRKANTQAIPALPVITALSQTRAQAGASITITGYGFNTGMAGNTVFVGPVKASVTSTSSTSLTITVPAGTATGLITVLNNASGLSSSFATEFITTFQSNSTGITPGLYQPRIDIMPGTASRAFTVSDLDGDGRSDIIFEAGSAANAIATVIRNVSTTGVISASSFAPKIEYTSGTGGGFFLPLAVADLDGDGKPDLIVEDPGKHQTSILRNTSVTGTLTASSFAPAVDLVTGAYSPRDIAISDIDKDGKPDILIDNPGNNSVSILRNLSTPGSITSASFAAPVDLPTGGSPYTVHAADLDGDKKPDIIVNYNNSFIIGIFRNNSVPGTIAASSFEPPVTLVSHGNPDVIAIADVNSDGRPDIIAPTRSNNLSVLRNTAVAGSITNSSFAAAVDFPIESFPGAITVADADGDGKPEVIIANTFANTISILRNTSPGGDINASSFAPRVDLAVPGTPSSVIVADIDNDGKPEILVKNSTTLSFFKLSDQSQAPMITSLSPVSASAGSTVTISGTNFNTTPSANTVYFGAVKAVVTGGSATSLTVTVPAGATYQSVSVLNTASALTAYSPQPFLPVFTSPAGYGINAGTYLPPINYTTNSPASSFPYAVAFGDLDGDGKSDMVVVHANSNTVSVKRNTSASGSLDAASFVSQVDFSTGFNPLAVLIQDLDGDGRPELVVTNNTPGTISIFRNTSSPGSISTNSFAAKVDYATGSGAFPYSTTLADVNLDGKPDLIVANYLLNTISVFPNQSIPGNFFAPYFGAKVDFQVGNAPRAVTTGDVDGDGKPDIIVANEKENSVSVLRNTSVSLVLSNEYLTSTFAPQATLATGNAPTSVVLSDIDGDGKPEIITGNHDANTISVFKNMAAAGGLTASSFGARVDFSTGAQLFAIAAGDADGDGKPDIITANSGANTLSILRNMSAAGVIDASSFAPKVDFATGVYPVSVALADLDGDGIAEVASVNAATGNVSVLKIRVSSQLPPVVTSVNPLKSHTGTAVTINGAYFNNNPAANIVYFGGVKAQVTGGGTTSITATVPAGASYQAVTVLNSANGLTGTGSRPFTPTFTNPFGADVPADFYQPKVDLATGALPYGVAIGDLDGDGKPDMVTANFNSNTVSVLRNVSATGSLSAASFGSKVDFATGTNPYALVISDLDGDGKPDIAVANYGAGSISVLKNTAASGSITAASFAPKTDFSTGVNSYPISIAAGDLNSDGRNDLVTANYQTQTISVFKNNAVAGAINAATFAAAFNLAPGGSPRCVLIGDVDSDFRMDIITGYQNTGKVSVSRNTGAGYDLTATSFPVANFFDAGSEPFAIALGDLNADGKPDLVVANHSSPGASTLSALRNTSAFPSVSFAPRENLPSTGTAPFAVTIGDVNGDGDPDVVAANSVSSTISVLRHKPGVGGTSLAAVFDQAVEFATGSYPLSVAVNDLNGDGTAEVITSNGASTVSVFKIGSPSFNAVHAGNMAEGMAGESMEKPGMNIGLYPNPSTGTFILQLMNLKAPVAAIEVLNAAGKTVQKRSVGLADRATTMNVQMSLAGQPAGVYYVKVTSVDGVQIRKVVLQR